MTAVMAAGTMRPAKLPRQSKVSLGRIHGVVPDNGVRNPGLWSVSSHRVRLTYPPPCCPAMRRTTAELRVVKATLL